ncbi:MAG TPA: DUF2203 domain-containing protein [Gemmatimonadales bacterium]|nr:DUF2203 domain-containing protein [Gemmatimonadales bacterium]
MSRKLFTLAEANRTLPLVKRIVQDIMVVYPQWKDLVAQYELVASKARPEWGESQEQLDLKNQIDAMAAKINDFLGELEQIGCEFKGFDEGLVDFHGYLEEREILWCWKSGEERITHWHELDAGFAGRQPLPEVLMRT